jgi:hypothetical protein
VSRPIEPHEAQRRRLASLFHDIFEVDRRGQEIFEVLYQRFAAHAKVHTSGGIDAVLKTVQDASHREVIEFIVTMCNVGRGVEESDPQPTQEDDHG